MPDLTCTIKRALALQIFHEEKILEMRPGTERFKGLKEGDTITFHWCSGERLLVKVMCDPHIYKSAEEAFRHVVLRPSCLAKAIVKQWFLVRHISSSNE